MPNQATVDALKARIRAAMAKQAVFEEVDREYRKAKTHAESLKVKHDELSAEIADVAAAREELAQLFAGDGPDETKEIEQ